MANQIEGIQGTQSQSSQSAQSTQISQVVAIQEQYSRQMAETSQKREEREVNAPNSVTMDEVHAAVNELNAKMDRQIIQTNFSVDDETGKIVVKVRDVETGDILRQIPSEEMLDFARNASKGVGVTLDTKL